MTSKTIQGTLAQSIYTGSKKVFVSEEVRLSSQKHNVYQNIHYKTVDYYRMYKTKA